MADADARRAALLVDDPDRYDALAAAYDDDLSFYHALRNSAQESLTDFEAYLELRRVFLQRGPTEEIRRRIEERLDRSLKNMVLESSPRGRAYPVGTLREVADRLEAFADIGVGTPSVASVSRTVLEHCYDESDGPAAVHDRLDELLSATPSAPMAVALLARARLTAALRAASDPLDRLPEAATRFRAVAPDESEDDRSADAVLAAARERSYADPEKATVTRAAVVRGAGPDAVAEYLYLAARETVESYRHGHTLTRAEVQLARRSLSVVESLPLWGDTDAAYVAAYAHVAQGIERGGARWLSDRAGQPPPDWPAVAESYAAAAGAMDGVDTERSVKYLSKAFRHAAHASDDQSHRRWLHESARTVLSAVPTGDGTDLDATVRGSLAVHEAREQAARARLALERGAYAAATDAVETARVAGDRAPVTLSLSLEATRVLAAGRQAEQRGEYRSARRVYAAVDDDRAACREALAGVKAALADGTYGTALDRATAAFDHDSVVVAAVEAATGLVPAGDVTVPDALAGVTEARATVLADTLSVYSASGTLGGPLRDRIESLLFGL